MDPDGLGDDGPITHTHNTGSHNTTHKSRNPFGNPENLRRFSGGSPKGVNKGLKGEPTPADLLAAQPSISS